MRRFMGAATLAGKGRRWRGPHLSAGGGTVAPGLARGLRCPEASSRGTCAGIECTKGTRLATLVSCGAMESALAWIVERHRSAPDGADAGEATRGRIERHGFPVTKARA